MQGCAILAWYSEYLRTTWPAWANGDVMGSPYKLFKMFARKAEVSFGMAVAER
jgi:hypothetical protein